MSVDEIKNYEEVADRDAQEYINQLNEIEMLGNIVITETEAENGVLFLQLYREFAAEEINAGRDFPVFSEWKELNKEALL